MLTLAGLVIYVLFAALFWYLIDFFSVPQPFNKILKAIIAVLLLVHLYVVLMGGAAVSSYYYF